MTFVYVSNAEDGDIGVYELRADGTLVAKGRTPVGKAVMPMATSPDKRFLFAAVRSQPYAVHGFAIDARSGALSRVGAGPLAESLAYISTDRTGRFLLGASYGGNLVSVNPIGSDGLVGEALQVMPTAPNAHSIRVDHTNRFAYAPHLGTDQVFQFRFDERTGRLTPNTPPFVQMKQRTGPRHLCFSHDNRFVYVLNELTATVTTLSIDAGTGRLAEVDFACALAPDTPLVPGMPRGAGAPARDTTNDIWASDLHLTPDGRFLYAAERTGSTLGAFSVDATTGHLTFVAGIATEKQPRGFAIDPRGRYLVASGEKSDTISSYSIDPSSGALTLVGQCPGGKGSNWVEIVAAT
jgi:6-phosphogluconolactonase